MYRPALLLATIALAAPLAAAESPRLMGVRVVAPGITVGEEQLRPFNWSPGTTLCFWVPVTDGSLIEIDAEGQDAIASAVDDTGRDLTPEFEDANGFTQRASIGGFPSIAPDGSGALVEISLPRVPAPGARAITLRATMALITASQQEELVATAGDFAVGSTIAVGERSFEVTANGKPQWGDAAQQIELKTGDGIDDIAGMAIRLADGRTLPLTRRGHSGFSGMGMSSYTITYDLPEQVATGALVLKRWTDRKRTELVIEREVGLAPDAP